MPHYLTIDLGTTLYKFAIFDERGEMLALARVAPPIDHPKPGWWEVNVAAFRETILNGCREVIAKVGAEKIAAISFASQANSFTLLDEQDQPLCPLILWTDERAAEFNDQVRAAAKSPSFRQETGLPDLGFQFAVAKMLRWRKENGDRFRKARFFFICDLLTYFFTKTHAADAGIAGLSGAANIHRLQWRTDALPSLGLDGITLPTICRPGTDLGVIDPAIARELNLPSNCRFVMGCLDQYAGAIGTGTTKPGSVTETTGTVLAAVRCAENFRADAPADVYIGPSFDSRYYFEMSFSSTSANLLEHYRNSLPDKPSFETLSNDASKADANGLIIHPFVDGEPIERCFRDVQPTHSRGTVVRAIMECVARQLKSQLTALCGNDLPRQLNCAGGGAKSRLWLEIKSQIIGVPCVASHCEEPTSLGAARLAMGATATT